MSDQRFKSGDRIGSFTVLCPCGAGAFGQVYLVRGDDGMTRALKVLSADRRSERELAGLLRFRRVEHPNLLHIDRLSTLPDGTTFYTMDAADNAGDTPNYAPDTLARRMRERAPLPPEELKRIMLELSDGLAALHRAHLMHRDIKPENILFVNGRATLADAGAVGEAGGTTLVGTPDYLAPDVCLQKRAFAATDDCYALGKVLYSALTGEVPRKFPSTPRTLASPEEVALFKAAERACTPPGVSAYRFRELLEHPEQAAPVRKWRWLAFAAAALILSCLALAAALYAKRPPTPRPAPEQKPTTAPPPPAEPTAAGRERASAAYSEAFVRKMKADEAELRAEQERIKSPKVQPVGSKRRSEVSAAEPTAAELVKKYRLSAEEQRLVDKWMAECISFDRRINRAYLARDNALFSKLMAEKKAKLPHGIDDFCGDEMRIRKYLAILTRDYTPAQRRRLEAALQYRRDALKKLLDALPADELAKWR